VRAVTIQYSAMDEHDLYFGTFLNVDCGKVGVTVDGVAPAESPVDLYLNDYGGTTANVKIASAVTALCFPCLSWISALLMISRSLSLSPRTESL
jgi:hypothetical protein